MIEETKHMKTPPKFNWRNTSQWRAVDLRVTILIAHLCARGVDFSGCSKSEVIEGIAVPHGYTSDAPKFIAMMDEAARFLPGMKRELDSKVKSRIAAFEAQSSAGID